MAIRPKTLPAAASPVILGSALALRDGQFQICLAIATLLCALLLQIGANLANDVFDYYRGADTSGDLFVFTFFGPAALCGTYFIQTGEITWDAILASLPILRSIWRDRGKPLNLALAKSGQLTLFFCILFSIGLLIPV